MLEFVTNINLLPFFISLIILLILIMAETLGAYLNLRPSKLIRVLFPRHLTESPLINVKFSKSLIFIFFLLNFSVCGFFIQFFAFYQHQAFFVFYSVIPIAIILSIFLTVFMIHCLDQIIKPKKISYKINLNGCLATVCNGNARPGYTAQAFLRDEFGQLHYVQIEPEFGELELHSKVILTRRKHAHYIAKKIAESSYE